MSSQHRHRMPQPSIALRISLFMADIYICIYRYEQTVNENIYARCKWKTEGAVWWYARQPRIAVLVFFSDRMHNPGTTVATPKLIQLLQEIQRNHWVDRFYSFFWVGHTVRKFDEHEMQEIPYIIWKYTLRQLHYHDFTLVSSGAQVSRPHAHYSRKKTSPSWLASSKEGDDKMALNFELTN